MEPSLLVVQDLEELHLVGASVAAPFLTAHYPVIEFHRLTSLHLQNGRVDAAAWKELLNGIRESLTRLELKNVQAGSDLTGPRGDDSWILPFPLPNLIRLEISKYQIRCSQIFVETLRECPALKHVSLELASIGNEQSLRLLAAMEVDLRVNVHLNFTFSDIHDVVVQETRKIVSMLGNKMTSFTLCARKWNLDMTTLLGLVASRCENLTAFSFKPPTYFESPNPYDTRRELEKAKLLLGPVFSDVESASKLMELSLAGDYGHGILESIFLNCVYLESLHISDCPLLDDTHLKTWVQRGARVSCLTLYSCQNISDEGVMPILISSSERLSACAIESCPKVTSAIGCVVSDHCRYVKRLCVPMPRPMLRLLQQKCFSSSIFVVPSK